MTDLKKSETIHLTSIKEARIQAKTIQNQSSEFKPIKLKSLQEARMIKKSSTSRTLSALDSSLNPDQSDSKDFKPKIKQNLSSNIDQITKPLKITKILNQEEQKTLNVEKIIKKLENCAENSENSKKTKNSQKFGSTKLLFKKKIVHKFVVSSPKKSPFRSKVEEITRQKSCINTTKSKIANESPSVLDFIVNTSIKSKKLTKDQEKGLISRLQNNHNFKNSK